MTFKPANEIVELIDRLIADSRESAYENQSNQLESFLSQYYRYISAEDLADKHFMDLKWAAHNHLQLAQKRIPGTPNITIDNPTTESHHWHSAHTIVDIVTDDLPFLVDSITMAINRHGLAIHMVTHPVMQVERDSKGTLTDLLPTDSEASSISESFMQFQIDRLSDAGRLRALEKDIRQTLQDVYNACRDWQAMRKQTESIIEELGDSISGISDADHQEARDFLHWIVDDHFTFLGYCALDHRDPGSITTTSFSRNSGLGLLKTDSKAGHHAALNMLPVSMESYDANTDFLTIAKANKHSTVHRPVYMDYIGIKQYDKSGTIIGEHCLLGLYTSSAYSHSTHDIPLIREKVRRVVARSGLSSSSHDGKSLQNIVESYPRDSLFQISEDEFFDNVMGILKLQERARIRLFVRRDRFGRFYSCLVYIPREFYSREIRLKFQGILKDAFDGHLIEFNTYFSESILARIHFTVYTQPDLVPKLTYKEIESRIISASFTWPDNLRGALQQQLGEEKGNTLFDRYESAFSGGYQDQSTAGLAVIDIQFIEKCLEKKTLGINFYRPTFEDANTYYLKLYSPDKAIPLTDILPMVENMGLRVMGEKPYRVMPKSESPVWIHEFSMVMNNDTGGHAEKYKLIFENALAKIWNGKAENDGFNCLVLGAGLNWLDTVLLRAYCRYLKQIRLRYSESYIVETLARNTQLVALLVKLFHQRFDPRISKREPTIEAIETDLNGRLDAVANLDEDRILRHFFNIIQATIRTNYYQEFEGEAKEYLSFKFDPSSIHRLPNPKPMYEIFVYSPRVEAVHLRGGKVARGGLRWSDRREDFRTEVLGLVKAQMVKNAVIVPVGSKGGFVVKQQPDDRELLMQEVVDCYKLFMQGLLDITDNIVGDDIVPPADVVRYDTDDPYLVVAADKGTATFSDIANGKAEEYGYWLGDGFASGGSVGYDHKKMGITARGAWESVQRHFRELGVNTQSEEFSVVGIGDMAGDVFGNGMLLSPHIRLVGAFNHLHIFLDPKADSEVGFKERQRLFQLSRSNWSDYNPSLISPGGGIFKRSAKSIILTPEVQQLLRINIDRLTPDELINAMLKAPVDLVWNGGIGTYVKSQDETDDDVRDRSNDMVRVNGSELRCRVFVEGGNLGMTQLGRIEYSRHGGLCYTDSIDNSAGVDCSDHEVNIKILLNAGVQAKKITRQKRNKLLTEMTDSVADLVLKDNYNQTQSISISASQAQSMLQDHSRLIDALEKNGRLDRELEYLPDLKAINERYANQEGLTRPELSILCSYAKMSIYDDLLASDVPEDAFLIDTLYSYFPERLLVDFQHEMDRHRLKREIIATVITNDMVNRLGLSAVFRLTELLGVSQDQIARAYTAAMAILDIDTLWKSIEALDTRISTKIQYEMLTYVSGLIERCTLWILRNRRVRFEVSDLVNEFRDGIQALSAEIPQPLSARIRLSYRKRGKYLQSHGVPKATALKVSSVFAMSSSLDIVEVARQAGREIGFTASIYFQLAERLELQWLREKIASLPVRNHWHTLAKSSLRSQLHDTQRLLTSDLFKHADGSTKYRRMVKLWLEKNTECVGRIDAMTEELRSINNIDFAMISVALNEVQSLLRPS